LRPLDDSALNTPEALIHAYQELFQEIIEQWRSGSLESAPDRADRLAVLNWMLQCDLVKGLGNASATELASEERTRLAELLARQKQVETSLLQPRRALAMADGTGINERVHIRGSHKILGDEVPRRFLEVLAGSEQPVPATGSGRLELAERMLA